MLRCSHSFRIPSQASPPAPPAMMASVRSSNQIMALYSSKKQKLAPPPDPAAAPISSASDITAQRQEETCGDARRPRSYSTHPTYPFPIADLQPPRAALLHAGIAEASAGKAIRKGDLDLLYFQPFVKPPAASALYQHLLEELPWYKVMYQARGMAINTPRYTTVFGLDTTAVFAPPPLGEPSKEGDSEGDEHAVAGTEILSSKTRQPVPMNLYQRPPRPLPRCLQELKSFVERATGETYNFALCNFYADGTHSISPHSDDESFLGPNPCIASLSLGGTRDFVMKHKARKDVSGEKFALRSGDMVVMRGTTQASWLHGIPKRTGKTQSSSPRINVTFRRAMNVKGSNNYSHYNIGSGPVHRFVDGHMVPMSG